MCHVTGKTSPQGKTLLHPLNPHGQPRGRRAPAWKRVPGRQADGLLQEGELGVVEAEDLVHHGRLRLHRQAQHGDGLPAAGPEQDLPAGEARCRGVHSTAVPAVPSPPPTRRKDRRAEGTAPSKGLHAPRSPMRVSRVCHAWLLLLPPFRQAHAWDRRPHHRCHCAPVTGACASWEAAQEQLDVSCARSSGEVPARGRAVFDSRRLCLNPRARNIGCFFQTKVAY